MPGLDYPFVYECSGCDAETVVKRADVKRADARDLHPDPDSLDAIDVVLQNRGWARGDLEGLLFCPDCT